MDHKANLEICEAASDAAYLYCGVSEEYIKTFDPPTVRSYIERAIECDELRVRCHDLANQVMVRDGRIMELEDALRCAVLAMETPGEGGRRELLLMAHEQIKGLLKTSEYDEEIDIINKGVVQIENCGLAGGEALTPRQLVEYIERHEKECRCEIKFTDDGGRGIDLLRELAIYTLLIFSAPLLVMIVGLLTVVAMEGL